MAVQTRINKVLLAYGADSVEQLRDVLMLEVILIDGIGDKTVKAIYKQLVQMGYGAGCFCRSCEKDFLHWQDLYKSREKIERATNNE